MYITSSYTNLIENKEYLVFVVGGNSVYANWLPNTNITNSYDKADVILFTGGSDVSPDLYNEKKHKLTVCDKKRDLEEVCLFNQAVIDKKKILGICRGSQLACVLSGGKLIQHQQNLQDLHTVYTKQGQFDITSYHHQAMYPFNLPKKDYLIIGNARNHSFYHLDGHNNELSPITELEICYFYKTQALGIQGHPEMLWNYFDQFDRTFFCLNYFYKLLMTSGF